jgi:hypothetical protein
MRYRALFLAVLAFLMASEAAAQDQTIPKPELETVTGRVVDGGRSIL